MEMHSQEFGSHANCIHNVGISRPKYLKNSMREELLI